MRPRFSLFPSGISARKSIGTSFHTEHLSLGLEIRDTWNVFETEKTRKFSLLLVIIRYSLLMEMETVQMALD
jgi:hypothetical protein